MPDLNDNPVRLRDLTEAQRLHMIFILRTGGALKFFNEYNHKWNPSGFTTPPQKSPPAINYKIKS